MRRGQTDLDVPNYSSLVPPGSREPFTIMREFQPPDLVGVFGEDMRRDRRKRGGITSTIGEERDGSVAGVIDAIDPLH